MENGYPLVIISGEITTVYSAYITIYKHVSPLLTMVMLVQR